MAPPPPDRPFSTRAPARDCRADYVLLNGRVRTVDSRNSVAQAVATHGQRILAVGDTDEVRTFIGTRTEVIDLQGREVVPGFNDAHHHFGSACAPSVDCKDPDLESIDDIQQAISAAAASRPPSDTWIRARGYNHTRLRERRHPTRWDLDRVAPRTPVLLSRTCGHIGVLNSRALELLGINDDSPDPPGGRYERIDGRLSGVVFERALHPAIKAAAPGRDELLEHLPLRAEACLRMGWTTIQDPGARNPALIPAYLAAHQRGRLPLRIRAFAQLAANEPSSLALFRSGISSGFGDDRLRIGPCKLMVDGSSSGPTAATRQPYASQPDFCGLLQLEAEELDAFVLEGRQRDFQMTMHAVGDRAIEMCLDAFARADALVPTSDPRHRIEHCAMCPPDLIERMRAQRVTPVVQPSFIWEFGDGYLRDYGPERGAAMFPSRRFLDAGVVVAGSTDAPVCSPEPLFAIQQAVTRLTIDGQHCGRDQRLSIAEAVRVFTYGSAYASREEHVLGSLEPGKLADLAVLSRGLEDVPPSEIASIEVDLTMVDGMVVFSR